MKPNLIHVQKFVEMESTLTE